VGMGGGRLGRPKPWQKVAVMEITCNFGWLGRDGAAKPTKPTGVGLAIRVSGGGYDFRRWVWLEQI